MTTIKESPESSDARVLRDPIERSANLVLRSEAALQALGQRVLQLEVALARGEVSNRPRRRGDRQAVSPAHVPPVKRVHAMDDQAGASMGAAADERHLRHFRRTLDQSPERTGDSMAQNGMATKVNDGRHRQRQRFRSLVIDQIDITIGADQPTGPQPMDDRAPADPGSEQLVAMDHVRLEAGDPCHLSPTDPSDLLERANHVPGR